MVAGEECATSSHHEGHMDRMSARSVARRLNLLLITDVSDKSKQYLQLLPAPLPTTPHPSPPLPILGQRGRPPWPEVEPNATIGEIKSMFHKSHPQWYPARQSIRLDPRAAQISRLYIWVPCKVFLTEYAGPLIIYLMFYFRVPFIYAPKYDFTTSKHWVVHLACMCHSFHYVKRLLETLFVHRFSHGTMPLRNIFKNCTYYWGFAAWMAYYINHPLYTPPIYGEQQVKLALIIFLVGSKTRKIPYPTKNPFTWIFLLVSCPNYTYELGSWLGFTVMTQCLPVAFFTIVGFVQMTVWAKGKHRSYLKEFRDYPPLRSPILPFIL
ncbi:hypothetical protein JZ751_029521 [Albula glossodonta]|uniref:Steroid 5-alpha reductase C-terminal domain-containing protein n=1 Tax=Albula glossodonta TaxID=121402 RepID=A0A8T2NBM3_9TELE|nr:hypothetical protein JZ751_029521 [Albula glossodonta]